MNLLPPRLALIAVCLLAATASEAAERSFPVGSFSEIMVTNSADVDVRTGSAASVVATGDPDDLDRLDIRVEGNRLNIGTKQRGISWSSRENITIRVNVPALSAATLSGSGNLAVDRVRGDFSGRISGSGDLRLPMLDSAQLALAISGSGDIMAAGRCGSGTISISGSGDVNATQLTCETLNASVSGSGDIAVRATGTAAIRVSGSGDITVTGGARCTTKSSGSSSISCS